MSKVGRSFTTGRHETHALAPRPDTGYSHWPGAGARKLARHAVEGVGTVDCRYVSRRPPGRREEDLAGLGGADCTMPGRGL